MRKRWELGRNDHRLSVAPCGCYVAGSRELPVQAPRKGQRASGIRAADAHGRRPTRWAKPAPSTTALSIRLRTAGRWRRLHCLADAAPALTLFDPQPGRICRGEQVGLLRAREPEKTPVAGHLRRFRLGGPGSGHLQKVVGGEAAVVRLGDDVEDHRREDDAKKLRYARWGESEYFLYDPRAEYVNPPLRGFSLVGAEYRPMSTRVLPNGETGLWSKTLRLCPWLEGPNCASTTRRPDTAYAPPAKKLSGRMPKSLAGQLEAQIAALRKG